MPGVDAHAVERVIGVGHSAGAKITCVQQAAHRSYDALCLLGFGAAGLPQALSADELRYAGDPDGFAREIVRLGRDRFGVEAVSTRLRAPGLGPSNGAKAAKHPTGSHPDSPATSPVVVHVALSTDLHRDLAVATAVRRAALVCRGLGLFGRARAEVHERHRLQPLLLPWERDAWLHAARVVRRLPELVRLVQRGRGRGRGRRCRCRLVEGVRAACRRVRAKEGYLGTR